MPDINTVLRMHFVRALISNVCGDNIEIIKRPASFILKRKDEAARDIQRIILIPPNGFTADAFNLMNSHDEAERATVQINGGVRKRKNGFSKLKKCILVASFNKSSMVSDLDKPYLKFDLDNKSPALTTQFHSAGEAPFSVVKSNGYGFYHNLINVSDDWVVVTLNKRLRPQRVVDLQPFVQGLSEDQANMIGAFYKEVLRHGDGIFKKPSGLINQLVRLKLDKSLPALAEMLYVYDNGRHEACSVFAIILKIGKTHPEKVTAFLSEAIKNKTVPTYYADQLIKKIKKFPSDNSGLDQSHNRL